MKAKNYHISPSEETTQEEDTVEEIIAPELEMDTINTNIKKEISAEDNLKLNENFLKLIEDIVDKTINKRKSDISRKSDNLSKLNENSLKIIEDKSEK